MKSRGLYKSIIFFFLVDHILISRMNFYQLSVVEQGLLISVLIFSGVCVALFRTRA